MMERVPSPCARKCLPSPADAKVLVVGLVRNAGGRVSADIDRLRQAVASFRSVQWLVVESDSTDSTISDLENLCATVPGFRFVSLGELQPRLPLRTQRIAHCRNAYLDELETHPAYADIDLVVMADLDGINVLVGEAAVMSCWARDDWDVCAANQAGPYYDIWALRHALWSPNDCNASYHFLVDHGAHPELALQATVLTRMITIAPDSPWIEVDSAFGGLAIYRREILQGLRYHGLSADGKELCEHVPLHAQILARGGRILINPRLICSAASEHTETLRLSKKFERLLRRTGKRLLTAVMPGRFIPFDDSKKDERAA